MEHLLNRAKNQQLKRLYSHVSHSAKGFFGHFGFGVNKPQQVEIRGQILENWVMEKAL